MRRCEREMMTGIVFTGGEGPPPEIIRALLDEVPGTYLIAAADSGLETAENAGLKPDWIIGDMDSIADTARLDAYPEERVMRYPKDKDYTDTELAFSLLREKGCDEIWIAGGGGGRVDHLFGIRSMLERDAFPARWILDSADIYCVDAAGRENGAALAVRLSANALVSVFPLGAGPWKASSAGLRWALDDLKWDRGFFGLSNMALGGEFTITVQRGRFMVVVPRGDQGLGIGEQGSGIVV